MIANTVDREELENYVQSIHAKVNSARDRWYKNADEIAEFLSSIKRCWDKYEWRNMLYSHSTKQNFSYLFTTF